MSEVQFDEPQYNMSRPQQQRNLLIDFLIEKGWAKDKQQAIHVLFGVVVACVLVSLWFFTKSNSEVKIPEGVNIMNSPNEPPKLAEPLL